ncbi:MAG: Hint domain-containing protein [Pseudomonadota bacterium]
MAEWSSSGFQAYVLDSGTTHDILSFYNNDPFVFDDLEMDTTFELGDVVFNQGNEFLGSVNFGLAAGGTVRLPVIDSVLPNEILVLVPASLTETDVVFPPSLDTNTLDTSPFPVCFAAGTWIASPTGEKLVENLLVGDLIHTAAGEVVAVKWIGRQTIMPAFSGPRAQPVKVKAGALGDGLPHHDLTLTADHALILDSMAVNASALVNGDTIHWVPLTEMGESFTVYHIETDGHQVILANGAPTETFVDVGTRRKFDNYLEYIHLYGEERLIAEMPMPRVTSSRLLPDAIKQRLGLNGPRLQVCEV